LNRLTGRECECLELLAQGIDTRDIATQLDVSLSTVHTHLKRAREKLGLPNVESLISFGARYCYPPHHPLIRQQA
jgi:DNA-binding CsgD family transcriptional regulator